jgi:hypothetical protein
MQCVKESKKSIFMYIEKLVVVYFFNIEKLCISFFTSFANSIKTFASKTGTLLLQNSTEEPC